jgi:hypothetical protein
VGCFSLELARTVGYQEGREQDQKEEVSKVRECRKGRILVVNQLVEELEHGLRRT